MAERTIGLVTAALHDAGWTITDYSRSMGFQSETAVSKWNKAGIPFDRQDRLRQVVGEVWWQRFVDAGLINSGPSGSSVARSSQQRGAGNVRLRSLDDALRGVRVDIAASLYRAAKDNRTDLRSAILKSVSARDDFAAIERSVHEERRNMLLARLTTAAQDGRYDEVTDITHELKELDAMSSNEVTLEEILEMG